MKVSTFVSENVSLSLALRNTVKEEIQDNRKQTINQFRGFVSGDDDDDEMQGNKEDVSGVRVGCDFIESPTTLDDFQCCRHNRAHVDDCKKRLHRSLEVKLSEMIAYYADFFIQEERPWSGQLFPEDQILCERINDSCRQAFFSAFHLGRSDGFEDGTNMLRAILGSNPASTTWLPYVEKKVETELSAPFAKIPIWVDTSSKREDLFEHMLERTLAIVDSVEAVMKNLLIYRLRLFMKNKRPALVDMGSFQQMETCLRDKIDWTVDRMYKMGHFCGFESGQNLVKATYNRYCNDDRFYTLMSTKDPDNWLVINKSKRHECRCFECPRCIHRRNGKQGESKLGVKMRMTSNKLKACAEQLKQMKYEH